MIKKGSCKKKIINQTSQGKLIKCYTCKQYHIEYKNLHFTFNKEEFTYFRNYFMDLDAGYWENENKHTIYNRKILVPVGHKNVSAMFNSSEVMELRQLFSAANKANGILTLDSINKEICFN